MRIRTGRAGTASLVLLAGLLLASCTGTPSSTPVVSPSPSPSPSSAGNKIWQPTDPAFGAIEQVLTNRAKAVADRSLSAFDATLVQSDPAFVTQQNNEFSNLGKLGVIDISYTVQHLALSPAQLQTTDPLLRPNIVEHVTIPGLDSVPIDNRVDFTFAEHNGQWLLAAETFPQDLAQARPWAPGPIAVARVGDVFAVTDESDVSEVSALARATAKDLARDEAILGVRAPMRVLVDVTSNTGDKTSVLMTSTGDLAQAFPIHVLDEQGNPSGTVVEWWVRVRPSLAGSLLGAQYPHLLKHELVHYVLSRFEPYPSWLEEGIAVYVSHLPQHLHAFRVSPAEYRQVVREARGDSLLPSASFYSVAGSYAIADGAVTYLVHTCGMPGVIALIKAYSGHNGFANGDAYTDRALEQVCDTTQKAVARGALAQVRTIRH